MTATEPILSVQDLHVTFATDEGPVRAGDMVVIAPGTPHKLWNPGPEPLVLLCCCAPGYSDADTELLEP